MYLPAVSKIVEKEITAPLPSVKGGKEVILIAEDDHELRKLMSEVFTQHGYTIVEADDGADAIEQFKKADRIDLLFLDTNMPRKNGREVYNEISAVKPDIRVLFTSGYTEDVILDEGIEGSKFNFIAKPVRPITLLNKVREIMDK